MGEIFRDTVAVITGAGSGIGRELALGLAGEGCRLALSDLDTDGLEETARLARERGKDVLTVVFDVADRERMYAFANEVIGRFGRVDILVNNAGVSVVDTVADLTWPDLEWIVNINLWGVIYGVKAFLPHLLKSPRGHIVNMSSMFGLVGIPSQSAYCLTKFAVRGFSESLRQELRDTKLSVTCVHPGVVRTNILRNSRFHKTVMGNTDHDLANKQFDRASWISPAKAAAVILKAVKKKKKRVLVGPDAFGADFLARLLPAAYDGLLIRALKMYFT